ncbi:hypothetical protein SpCBS45565_g01963 [Spizellomyces sp. 'palustris']|nr:hypothetical protein SpCBS45565_g01963 [Spizellomyces sp. 'palustris']
MVLLKHQPSRDLIPTILKLHASLSEARSLDPSPAINALFSALVELCERNWPRNIVEDVLGNENVQQIVGSLRSLCSEGEFRLEMEWVVRILEGHGAINDFPYYNNYIDLTRLELNALLSLTPPTAPPTQYIFIGSGPLPLTSICLAQELSDRFPERTQRIHNMDLSDRAIQTSSKLVGSKLDNEHISQMMSFEVCDVSNGVQLSEFDVVYLAALVGLDSGEKRKILERVRQEMRQGALLVVRSAHSLRGLLYPPVEIDSLEGFDPLLVVHPHNHVINSVLIARRV